MKITIDNPTLVYSPPVNENTQKWGVYAIPKMWRNHSGELVVRFNGEQDDGMTKQIVPNLYFISKDDGDTWEQIENGDDVYGTEFFLGINPSFTKLANGDIIGIRHPEDLAPVPENISYVCKVLSTDHAMIEYVYRYKDIPDKCIAAEVFRKRNGNITFSKLNIDFPERLIGVTGKAFDQSKSEFVPVPKKVLANLFLTPFLSAITQLQDGTLAAVCHGQHPDIKDRHCEEAYLLISKDGGETWKKRSTIASDTTRPEGCVGDGGEISLTQTSNGNLVCVMRAGKSKENDCISEALLCLSADNGYTWTKPVCIADSHVTPHVIALKDGLVILVYGRPGVHFKVSEDNGLNWSNSYPIIGKTLSEELAGDKDYMDFMYFDSISYSNTFIEKLSDDTILILYNNQKYDDGDGKHHKAAFVRKITITK